MLVDIARPPSAVRPGFGRRENRLESTVCADQGVPQLTAWWDFWRVLRRGRSNGRYVPGAGPQPSRSGKSSVRISMLNWLCLGSSILLLIDYRRPERIRWSRIPDKLRSTQYSNKDKQCQALRQGRRLEWSSLRTFSLSLFDRSYNNR